MGFEIDDETQVLIDKKKNEDTSVKKFVQRCVRYGFGEIILHLDSLKNADILYVGMSGLHQLGNHHAQHQPCVVGLFGSGMFRIEATKSIFPATLVKRIPPIAYQYTQEELSVIAAIANLGIHAIYLAWVYMQKEKKKEKFTDVLRRPDWGWKGHFSPEFYLTEGKRVMDLGEALGKFNFLMEYYDFGGKTPSRQYSSGTEASKRRSAIAQAARL